MNENKIPPYPRKPGMHPGSPWNLRCDEIDEATECVVCGDREQGFPVTVGEAIIALRQFAIKKRDYEKMILEWVADYLEQINQGGD